MNNLEIIKRKIEDIKSYIKILRTISKKYTTNYVLYDTILKGALERYFFLLIQSTIDLASAVVAYEKIGKSFTYMQAFELLAQNKIIPTKTLPELKAMIGARNILVHEYAKVDLKILLDDLEQNIKTVQKVMKYIKKHLLI